MIQSVCKNLDCPDNKDKDVHFAGSEQFVCNDCGGARILFSTLTYSCSIESQIAFTGDMRHTYLLYYCIIFLPVSAFFKKRSHWEVLCNKMFLPPKLFMDQSGQMRVVTCQFPKIWLTLCAFSVNSIGSCEIVAQDGRNAATLTQMGLHLHKCICTCTHAFTLA